MNVTYQEARDKAQQLKNKLINQAQNKGVWENFGQKELRELKDYVGFYPLNLSTTYTFLDLRKTT